MHAGGTTGEQAAHVRHGKLGELFGDIDLRHSVRQFNLSLLTGYRGDDRSEREGSGLHLNVSDDRCVTGDRDRELRRFVADAIHIERDGTRRTDTKCIATIFSSKYTVLRASDQHASLCNGVTCGGIGHASGHGADSLRLRLRGHEHYGAHEPGKQNEACAYDG